MTYDFDCVIWDTVGGAYTSESMKKASGGSEKEIVQLAEGLAGRGFEVACFNQAPSSNAQIGDVSWGHLESAKNIRCKTLIIQRYSTIPDAAQVLPDRMVVRATDVYGNYYDHLSTLNFLCVSNWQAKGFRDAGFSVMPVVPAMLDDDYYELATTPKVKGRFIYASAYMKGLKETLAKWKDLRDRFPTEMRDCELHVTSPGYGKLHESPCSWLPESQHAIIHPDLAPRELAKYIATCEGLFYVNTFPECHPMVIGIAQAVGCKTHVLCKNGIAGCAEATPGGVTENEKEFDSVFIGLLGQDAPRTPLDFRVSTVLPQWLAALKLDEKPVDVREQAKNAWRDWDDKELARELGPFDEASREDHRPFSEVIADAKEKDVNSPTVCLVMLAKNAESTLKRALDSVRGFVDCAVFQFDDEMFSDAMRQIILDSDIPSVFTYVPWVNFSVNRNKLLERERQLAKTYVLTLDADDEFVGLSSFDKSKLTCDVYDVEIHDFGGSTRYHRRMLWKNDGRFHYEGPAHEFLVEKGPVTTGRLQGVHYVRHGGVALTPAQTREKYLRDVRLFVAELKVHPEDARSVYYLAQSLEDASCGTDEVLLRQALKVYQKRALMAGYIEEKFIAQMKVGRLCVRFKEAASSIGEAFEEAALIHPSRAVEAVYEILLYHNEPSNVGASYARGLAAARRWLSSRPPPENPPEGFIVDVEVYRWKYALQFGLALYYTDDKEEARKVFEELLTKVPVEQRSVVRANLQFCMPAVTVEKDLLEELESAYGTPPRTASAGASVPWFEPKQ